MAYTPVNGLEINCNFITSGAYAPVNGLEINGDFSGDTGVYARALIIHGGGFRQIEDNEAGGGLLHVTDINGDAIVYGGAGGLRTLYETETLMA